MKTAFVVDETIPRSAAAVWAALIDWERATEWMKGLERIAADGETRAGTELTFFARGKERKAHVTECEVERRLVIRAVQGSVTADYVYTLEAQGPRSTRVTLEAACATGGFWSVIWPLLRFMMKRFDGKQLVHLRASVEARS